MSAKAYSGVRKVVDLGLEFVEVDCPSCGASQRLTDGQSRGHGFTECPSCRFRQRVDWLAHLEAQAVRK